MQCPAYIEAGNGPGALIFLHGVGGNKESWSRQIASFPGWRTIAWDAPGYGDSAPLVDFTWANLALSLRDLMDFLSIAKAVLVGHSMGGMVAQEFAATFPERLQALVLSATSPAFGNPDGDWQREFVSRRLAPLDAGHTMADLAPGLVAGLIGESPESDGVDAAIESMSRVPPATYRAAVRCLTTFDRRADLARISAPTLALAGENDTTAPPAMMQKMAGRIPGAVYRSIAGAGHLANLEQPAAYNRMLDEFLRSL